MCKMLLEITNLSSYHAVLYTKILNLLETLSQTEFRKICLYTCVSHVSFFFLIIKISFLKLTHLDQTLFF